MYKSLESLCSVNLYCTVHAPNKASVPSFSISKENSMAPCPLQFSVKPSVLDVLCVPHEANLCLLHPGLWPVGWPAWTTPVNSLIFWLQVLLMEKMSRILEDKERVRLRHLFSYLTSCWGSLAWLRPSVEGQSSCCEVSSIYSPLWVSVTTLISYSFSFKMLTAPLL